MEPRIQYAKTEDGVSIAYSTRGHYGVAQRAKKGRTTWLS
jgi:hypothetical protein